MYFDDFILIDDVSETARDKGSADSCAKALGVIFDLGDCNLGIVYVRNTAERQRELEAFINGILQRGKLQRGELAVLQGRLRFANNQVFGRQHESFWRVDSYVQTPSWLCARPPYDGGARTIQEVRLQGSF